MDARGQLQVFATRALALQLSDIGDDIAHVEVEHLDLDLVSVDLREVQDIIDDPQQDFARAPDRLRLGASLR